MYVYDNYDHQLVAERIEQYRHQTNRYLAGDLTEDEFKPLRLMNGVYIQTHAPMLRVAVPYGLLSSVQFRVLAEIADTYDKGYGHFTTRQNIQYNWPKLEAIPDILELLASVEMHAIQTSGNCIRNVTSDHLAGVNKNEIEDPRPYCEIIRQWSTLHPEFAYLPRKFKIAVTGSAKDRAATQVHDIGLHLIHNAEGEIGFQVLVGGGLGRTPVIGKVINKFLAKEDLLSYLEAILRVYNLNGRRDNKYKARIKILVNAVGIDAFREQVEQEWQSIRGSSLTLATSEVEHYKKFFLPINYDRANIYSQQHFAKLKNGDDYNSDYNRWFEQNTVAHKVKGYHSVYLSLKAHGEAPGDITSSQMRAVADLAEQYNHGEITATHSQNLLFANVHQDDLFDLWQQLKSHDLATANIGSLTDIICCPGLDFCGLANAESISVSQQIQQKFNDLDRLHDIGAIKINISGCMNACAHHHVGHIGILGVDKHGVEFYQITLGGSSEEDASLGKVLGPSVAKSEVADTIEKIITVYLAQRTSGETFLQSVRRIGVAPFKSAIYA